MKDRSNFVLASTLFLAGLVLAPMSFSATIYLKPAAEGGNDLRDGLSWVHAKATLQAAANAAIQGGGQAIVMVKGGLYDLQRAVVNQSVAVYGGCRGTEINPGDRPLITSIEELLTYATPSIFSGIGPSGFRTRETCFAGLSNASYILDRVVIEGWAGLDGAGSRFEAQNLTIKDCIFRNNNSLSIFDASQGAGIRAVARGNVFIQRNYFLENVALKGGGISLDGSGETVIEQNVFQGNQAELGGGIAAEDYGRITLRLNFFTQNRAFSIGGAASVYSKDSDSRVLIDSNLFYRNEARNIHEPEFETSAGALDLVGASGAPSNNIITNNLFIENRAGRGGGINIRKGVALIKNNQFYRNWAAHDGGALLCETVSPGESGLSIEHNIFDENSAEENAGACYIFSLAFVQSNQLRFVNNLLTGNSAGEDGGAVYLSDLVDFGTLTNNTIAYNTAGRGGGVYIDQSFFAREVSFYNNLVAFNSGGGFFSIRPRELHSFFNNCAFGNEDGNYLGTLLDFTGTNGNISADPLFQGDYTLQNKSPCINVGDNNALFLPRHDLNGEDRIMGKIVDIGAFEKPID